MEKGYIKNQLLTAEYGRFDHIDQIVPKEVLLVGAPRIVVSYLVSELGVEKKDVPMPALRSWLFNYRKKAEKKKPAAIPLAQPETVKKEGRTFTDTKGASSDKSFDF